LKKKKKKTPASLRKILSSGLGKLGPPFLLSPSEKKKGKKTFAPPRKKRSGFQSEEKKRRVIPGSKFQHAP